MHMHASSLRILVERWHEFPVSCIRWHVMWEQLEKTCKSSFKKEKLLHPWPQPSTGRKTAEHCSLGNIPWKMFTVIYSFVRLCQAHHNSHVHLTPWHSIQFRMQLQSWTPAGMQLSYLCFIEMSDSCATKKQLYHAKSPCKHDHLSTL